MMSSNNTTSVQSFRTPAFSFTNDNIHTHYASFALITYEYFVSCGLTAGSTPVGVDHVFFFYKNVSTKTNKRAWKEYPVVLVEKVTHVNFVVSIQNSKTPYVLEQLETFSSPYVTKLEETFGPLQVKNWFEAAFYLPDYLMSHPKTFKHALRKKHTLNPGLL